MITPERLREALYYDPDTGIFTWKIRTARRTAVGMRAGCLRTKGYVGITLDQHIYLAHRLAWLYVHGAWPRSDLDHKDRNRSNNKINNLREATRSQNKANGSKQVNRSGFRGVRQNGFKYIATIKWHRKRYHVGSFDTAEAAYAAYCVKAIELHGEFAA